MKVSDEFRETLRHIRAGDDAIAKAAWRDAIEYVAELEDFKRKVLEAVKP